jgi:hypothetical protein
MLFTEQCSNANTVQGIISPMRYGRGGNSGYQADTEQQSNNSVLSRTWELATNAVEAMKGVVDADM